MKTVALLLLAGLFGSGVRAQDTALETAKAEYTRRREAIQTTRDETVGKALAVYRKELDNLLANVRPQGNLDYVLAIENETKRLAAGGGAPAEPAAKEFAHLRRIQWAARQTEDKADKDLAEQAAKLRAAYTAELERLEKVLVAANRIDEAKAVREEKAAVEGRAICGKWLFVGQFPRILTEDGKIFDHGNPNAIGNWTYIGDGRFKIETNQGRHVNTARLDVGHMELKWVATDGKPYSAIRQ
ncbi:MAG: hypothetical protein RBU25_13035 [Lentisphaeria bacterium]|nr:hypothetical protein [Lentisphaeria bacterium]